MYIERVGKAAGALLFCGLALACGEAEPERQSEGAALASASVRVAKPVTLDLSQCSGTECQPMGTERPDVGVREERTCDPGAAVELTPVWSESFVEPLDPSCEPQRMPCFPQPSELECEGFGSCTLSGFNAAAAPDGTLWVVASMAAPGPDPYNVSRGGVWLTHRGPKGEELGTHVLSSEDAPEGSVINYAATISVDERGHLFVTSQKMINAIKADPSVPFGDSTHSIAEYDQDGEAVGRPIALVVNDNTQPSGLARVEADGDGHLVIAQPQLIGGGIALLSIDSREPLWIQARPKHLGFIGFAHDVEGRTTLLTQSPDYSASGRIERFGPDGKFMWERTLPWRTMRNEFNAAALGAGPDGRLYLAGLDDMSLDGSIAIHEFAADVASLAITHIVEPPLSDQDSQGGSGRSYESMQPVFAPDGTLMVSAGTRQSFDDQGRETAHTAAIYELSADAKSCRALRWDNGGDATQVVPLQDGSLYFAGQNGFGRLAR